MGRNWRPPSMRRTLKAQVKVALIRALVKSLHKDFSLVNGQVFLVRYRVWQRTEGDLVEYRPEVAVHFGHPSRVDTDPPLVQVSMTRDQWRLTNANIDEINQKCWEETGDEQGKVSNDR